MATDNELEVFNEDMATLIKAKARIAELEAQISASRTSRVSFKVGEKGGLSVYGIGRFPVTLYITQWERLIGVITDGSLVAFIKANAGSFAVKPVKA